MKEFPDDELDKLFRKSSEEFEHPFEADNWRALKKRLDAEDNRTGSGWLKKIWPFLLALFLIPTVYLGYIGLKDKDAEVVAHANRSTRSNPDKPAEPVNSKPQDPGKSPAEISKQSPNTASRSDYPDAGFQTSTNTQVGIPAISKLKKTASGIEKQFNHNVLSHRRLRTVGVDLETGAVSKPGGDGIVSPNDPASTGRQSNPLFRKNTLSEKSPDSESDELIKSDNSTTSQGRQKYPSEIMSEKQIPGIISALPVRDAVTAIQIRLPEISQPIIESNQSEAPHFEKPSRPKIAFRLGYSPDLTTVGLEDFSKPGAAYSLTAEYNLAPRLYLHAGVVRSIKKYAADSEHYYLRKYVSDINKPSYVKGICEMLELPIGLRYDLAEYSKTRWFAGSALTSYYMAKEKYVYEYDQYVHGQKYGWEGSSGWQWFSNLNLSAGYERMLTRKISIVAEPYIQVPLRGVGYGKARLTTVGFWISVRYSPRF